MADNMTRADAIELDVIATQKAQHKGMSFQERKQKNKNHGFRVVQEGSAGGQTVNTELHPSYGAHQAKAKAKTMAWAASSSSTSWSQQKWSTEEWSYKRW